MNPFNLSPGAVAFWGSAIRHLLTLLAGILVAHGYVTQQGANLYIEELVGAALYAGGNLWSNRVAYWQEIKRLIARAMPAGTTDVAVTAKVIELQQAGALPSVFTPANVTPSIVKP